MATSVKNLNKKNGRMAVEVIDAPYKEELVITSVENGNARIEGTATLQVMAYIIELGGLLDKSSNFVQFYNDFLKNEKRGSLLDL